MKPEPSIFLRPGRNKSILQHHPWIFSGSIGSVQGSPEPGETVSVFSEKKEFLGRAAFNLSSNIRARMWTFTDKKVDELLFHKKIESANESRKRAFGKDLPNAYRVVYGESDGLPGVIVDKYADYLVIQVLSAGAEYWKNQFVDILQEIFRPKTIYERSDVDVRKLEGMVETKGILYGEEPPELIEIIENGFKFQVDIINGQKTGFYLDQRANRKAMLEFSNDKEILNCFAYTGGFTVYGLHGGAKRAVSIDSSGEALEQARKNVTFNNHSIEKTEWITGDVFVELRKFRDRNRKFDLIVLDPPKFAPTQAQVEKAARGYKDINLLAFKLLTPGGILFTFSCSGGVSADLFQKIVAGAALDAGVDAHILRHLSQDMDHPIALNFPESAYLKGLICKIT